MNGFVPEGDGFGRLAQMLTQRREREMRRPRGQMAQMLMLDGGGGGGMPALAGPQMPGGGGMGAMGSGLTDAMRSPAFQKWAQSDDNPLWGVNGLGDQALGLRYHGTGTPKAEMSMGNDFGAVAPPDASWLAMR